MYVVLIRVLGGLYEVFLSPSQKHSYAMWFPLEHALLCCQNDYCSCRFCEKIELLSTSIKYQEVRCRIDKLILRLRC